MQEFGLVCEIQFITEQSVPFFPSSSAAGSDSIGWWHPGPVNNSDVMQKRGKENNPNPNTISIKFELLMAN